ncbi:MAG: GNAT family N-acetyltransferase [Dermatophilaceae bacterium]
MTRMRRATVHDLPGVYRVCLATGAAGSDASGLYIDPDLLGHVFAGPYLVYPDAVALVVHDDAGVAGYCLGVPDTAAFDAWMTTVWLPPLRERYPQGSGTGPDARLVELLHLWPGTDDARLARYPAHLHVDLLPRLQRRGWGRRVVESVLDELATAGASGVHLGVDTANPNAPAFYERLGFTVIRSDETSRHYGLTLPRGFRSTPRSPGAMSP